jgi:hypothetical protein
VDNEDIVRDSPDSRFFNFGVSIMKQSSRSVFAFSLAPLALGVLVNAPLFAQDYKFTISTAQVWTDTGVDLHDGDTLAITAAAASSGNGCDPAGVAGASSAQKLPVATALPGALVARTQENGSATLVGASQSLRVPGEGHLFLGINAEGAAPCQGSFAVKVHITPRDGTELQSGNKQPVASTALAQQASQPAPTKPASDTPSATSTTQGTNTGEVKDIKGALSTAAQTWLSGQFGKTATANSQPAASSSATDGTTPTTTTAPALPPLKLSTSPLDSQLRSHIDSLPRRVNDQFQNQGDMVNFVIVGELKRVQEVLTAAEWHVADRDVRESVLKAALETYQKKAYLAMPMSELYLFGRVQDYGYEQAEAYAVVASRHHFRIWKAAFQFNGMDVWVGAGTHDIGFEKDQRNGKVTHKIDPAVDGERDNIGASLQKTEKIKSLTYYLPPNPVQDARNATGGGYHSDGRILVVQLQ